MRLTNFLKNLSPLEKHSTGFLFIIPTSLSHPQPIPIFLEDGSECQPRRVLLLARSHGRVVLVHSRGEVTSERALDAAEVIDSGRATKRRIADLDLSRERSRDSGFKRLFLALLSDAQTPPR